MDIGLRRAISHSMEAVLAPFRRMVATVRHTVAAVRHWAEMADGQILLPLALIAVAGPLGEIADVALFSELELEFLASDLGLEVVTSAFIYGYHLLLMLLGAMAVAVVHALIVGDGRVPVPALVSCRLRPLGKVPIA
jgi:hypothetical protein